MNKTEFQKCFAEAEDGKTCYALTEKKCENCSFYKPKDQVPGYSKFIPKEKKNNNQNKIRTDKYE